MKTIFLAGLGNPGKKYEKTRHNTGFMFIDYFWEKFRNDFDFSDWELKKRLNAEISIGKANGRKIILLKPQTFMNLSGEAVSAAVEYYKILIQGKASNNLFIVHDEIDLPLGKYKFSANRSSAGHKGVQNIIDQLGTKNFVRLRIGIDNRNKNYFGKISTDKKIPTDKYVLGKFMDKELKIFRKTLEEAASELMNKIK